MDIRKMVPGLLIVTAFGIGCFALLQRRCIAVEDRVAVREYEPAPGLGKLLPTPERMIEAVALNPLG